MIRFPIFRLGFLSAVVCSIAAPTMAATITVNTSADSALATVCSLRSAILTANGGTAGNCTAGAVGADTIVFQITPNDGTVKSLTFASPLPAITSPLTINGITGVSGASANTSASGTNAQLKIRLNGTGVSGAGLQINSGGAGSTISGLIIVNFGGSGIAINGASNVSVLGNFIGIDSDGTTAAGNGTAFNQGGVRAEATAQDLTGLRIGSEVAADRNLISGNLGPGVSLIDADSVLDFGAIVAGNLIGTTRDGLSGRGNNGRGITVSNAKNVQIGIRTGATAQGACTGGCNVVAANFGQIELTQGDVNGALIRSNHIGVNALGTGGVTSGFPNTLSALFIIQASGNMIIGGAGVADGNVISGATNNGLDIQNFGQTGTITLRRNFIGTNSAGTSAIRNGAAGIAIQNTDHNIQIGTTLNEFNLISGNGQDGILLEGSSNVVITNNRIGTQADGVSPLGNGARGIFMFPGASSPNNNRIGAVAGQAVGGNIIAFNGANSFNAAGISISSGTGNRISRNSIFSNRNASGRGIGIDLQGDGSTPNDVCDGDTGVNNLQNFPVNLSAPTANTVSGQLTSALGTYEVEVYATPVVGGVQPLADGKTFLVSTNVTIPNVAGCPGSFSNVATSIPVPANSILSAVAISSTGNTSEFTLNPIPVFQDGFE